jgi:hypothetical protein
MPEDTTASEYENLVRQAYLGEVFGAGFLAELLASGAHAGHRSDLQWLFMLEETTRRRLAPYLDLEALQDEQRRREQAAREFAGTVVSNTWTWFMSETTAIARRALPDL